MEPLSRSRRRIYLALCALLFVISIPLAILYASGYRFRSDLSLVATGGVYLNVPISDAVVSINGEEIGTTGLFSKNFYVDNLRPGSYAVHVALDGYYPWYKSLAVEKRVVTVAEAFLVPEHLPLVRLVRTNTPTTTASTSRAVSRLLYDSYIAEFATSTDPGERILMVTNDCATGICISTTTVALPYDTEGGVDLYIEKGVAHLEWTRSTSTIPSAFCMTPSQCQKRIVVAEGKGALKHAVLFNGGVLYQSQSGVFLTEADVRPTPLTVPIYPKAGADFRIIDGALLVKDADTLYEVTGF